MSSIEKNDYIGISDDRLQHTIGVARKAYQVALNRGHGEEFAKKMFVLGFLHDIGYEFCKDQPDHATESAKLLMSIIPGIAIEDLIFSGNYQAIRAHGKIVHNPSEEWKIINLADMTIDSQGNPVTFEEREKDIISRYGESSQQHQVFCEVKKLCNN